MRLHFLALELIYVMLELFTTRFFITQPAMSKPDIPVSTSPKRRHRCCAQTRAARKFVVGKRADSLRGLGLPR
jgi:hypothetical protein